MVEKKLLSGKNVTYKKLNYANFFNGINADFDQYILPVTYSNNTYNFSFVSGALTTGLGISDLKLPATYTLGDKTERVVNFEDKFEFKASWLFRKKYEQILGQEGLFYSNYLIFQTTSGDFYVYDICTNTEYVKQILNINLSSVPVVLNYNLNGEDSVLICSEEGMWVFNLTSSYATKIENAPQIKSMCLHYERLFAITHNDHNAVWFSDDLNPTNWNVSLNEAGFIKFNDERGMVNKIVSFNDYVYVFRDYGISKITAYAQQTEFSANQLFVSSGKIYGNSVCVCGDKILMLTQNGIYVFDGYSTTKLNLNINKLLENTQNPFVQSCYSNGKYYLACNLNFNDGKQIGCEVGSYNNNVLLELDLNTNTLNILRGVDVRHLNAVADDKVNKVIAFYYSNGKYMLGEVGAFGALHSFVLPKCWTSPLGDLGYPEKQKIVKTIYLKSNVPVKITIRTERVNKTFNAVPKNNLIKLNTLVKGNLVAIDFETSQKECTISSPTVVVGLVWSTMVNLHIIELTIYIEIIKLLTSIFAVIAFQLR